MKIARIEDLHADGGWRTFSFLKVTTDDGLVGWSEFNETGWNPGLTAVIRKLGEQAIGQDPRAFGRLAATLTAATRMAAGGIALQAVAAIENACLDIAGKAAGVPVCALFGGPYREHLPVYWSHCGSFRARNHELFEKVIGSPPLRTLDDVKALGKEAVKRGYRTVKANPLVFDGERPRMLNSGFQPAGLDLGQNYVEANAAAIAEQVAALRDGLGPKPGLMLDLNFSMKPEGVIRLARALEPYNLTWLETDMHDAGALAHVRRSVKLPIASLETLHGRRQYRPFFESYSVDVAVVDVIWNGFSESLKISSLAESFEVNCAPHNFYGPLADLISAHFCAAIPNFRIMEFEADDVPWKGELVSAAPKVENGELVLSRAPGWGAEVNEQALKAHPPRQPR